MSDDKSNMPETNPAAHGDAVPPPAALPVLSYATPGAYQSCAQRDGPCIVLPYGTELPNRCIDCGLPAEARMAVRLWLILPMKLVRVNVPMCGEHARKHRRAPWLNALFAMVFVAACLLAYFGGPWTEALVVSVIIACFVYGSTSPVRYRRHNRTGIWLSGADKAFLDSLPAGPSESRE